MFVHDYMTTENNTRGFIQVLAWLPWVGKIGDVGQGDGEKESRRRKPKKKNSTLLKQSTKYYVLKV